MEDNISELISHFGPYDVIFEDNDGDRVFAYLGTERDFTVHIMQANEVNNMDITCILEYDKEEGCLIAVESYYGIPDYKDLTIYEFADAYMIHYGAITETKHGLCYEEAILYVSDQRLRDLEDHITSIYDPKICDLPNITVEQMMGIAKLEPDEYDSYQHYIIWLKDEKIVYTIPSMPIKMQKRYMIARQGICKCILDTLPLNGDIMVEATDIGRFLIIEDRIVVITENLCCRYSCNNESYHKVYPIADHPYIPYISAKKAIAMIREECESGNVCRHDWALELDKFIALQYPYDELKEGITPFGLIKDDTIDIQARYHFSMLKAGYPYFIHNTVICAKVIEMANKCGFKYRRVKYPIFVGYHGELLEMHYTEDMSLSLLKKCNVIKEHDGGCCSQRHCESYDLEIDAIVPDQSRVRNAPKMMDIPKAYKDMHIVYSQ